MIARSNQGTQSPRQRQRGRRWFHGTGAALLVVMITLWLLMRYAGDRSAWSAVLLLMPRWPLLVVLGSMVLWWLFVRTWVGAILMVACAWFAIVPLMGCRLAWPATRTQRSDLRILTCNVHRRQLNPDAFKAYIAEMKPDVVALQDWTSAFQEELFPAAEWSVRRSGELLVASKFPVSDPEPIDIGNEAAIPNSEQGEAAMFSLETPSGPVTIVNLHFASPHIGVLSMRTDGGAKLSANAKRRWIESGLTRARMEKLAGAVVVVGDFNTTPASPILREQWSDYQDSFEAGGSGCGYTYFNNHTQLRIDHVYANGAWDVGRSFVGPFVGSPHRPLVVDLSHRPQ